MIIHAGNCKGERWNMTKFGPFTICHPEGAAFRNYKASSERQSLSALCGGKPQAKVKGSSKGKSVPRIDGFFRSLTNFSIWWPSTPLPIPTSVYSPGESIICKLPHSFPTSSLWAVQYLQRVSPSNKTSNVQVVGQL